MKMYNDPALNPFFMHGSNANILIIRLSALDVAMTIP